MKKVVFCILALFAVNQLNAQWASPGTGLSYTLETLCLAAPSAVQSTSTNQYDILQSITISDGDTLTLESSAELVHVSISVVWTVRGTMRTADRTQPLLIQGDDFEVRFEDATQSRLFHLHVRYCQGIKLINSDVVIDSCEFDHFSNHVISFMNCSPTIQNSYFHDNQACAIQSALNSDGCPSILNNVLYNNVLGNTNNPQINIGPGTTDTIRIIGNLIEGVASNMSGGIGISNMFSFSQLVTHVLVKDNLVKNNRYGYTQNGSLISSELYDNQFIDNNLEVNPNNGGSGVSIWGDATCTAKLRRNLITGNLWGVTAIQIPLLDMGTAEDPGHNLLYNNGNGGVEYELYNNSNSSVDAIGNYWGCDNDAAAEDVIFHWNDNTSYGLVNYLPLYVIEPEITGFDFLVENNPALAYDYYDGLFGVFMEDDTIAFYLVCVVPDLSNAYPTITKPWGITVTPDESQPQNFLVGDVIYTASTPHQSTRPYVVHLNIGGDVPDNVLTKITLTPNPVTQGYFVLDNPTGETLGWRIFTTTGQCVMRGEAQEGVNRIATKGLTPGTYLVYMQKGNAFVTKKLIVR